MKKSLSRKLRLILAVAGLAVLLVGTWALWWEPSSLQIVRRSVVVSPWHAEHSGLRIAVLSDLHVGSPYRGISNLKRIVAATNAEKPDLIVLLGDYVIQGVIGGHFVDPESIATELGVLKAPLGVVSILGNHDWWYNGERVRSALESRGLRVLENQSMRVTYQGQSFWLCGLGDLWTRGDNVLPTVAAIRDNDPIIALMHNPDLFPGMPARVSLSLAGHTHGGQVNLPLVGRLVVPSKFGQRYAYGLIEENGRKLFVTQGIGTSILPVRFGAPPEIVILTVMAAD
jgi:predicted MPP superfamily phosphohydrolase